MPIRLVPFLLLAGLLPASAAAQTASDTGLVDLHTVVPGIRVPAQVAPVLVRPSVAAALANVARRLGTGGIGLEVVAGRGRAAAHASGGAVDVRLVDLSRGTLLPMGSELSASDQLDTVAVAGREARYRGLLSRVMGEEGFVGDPGRWWHYELSR